MVTKSIWETFDEDSDFPTLIEDLTVDVAIIGGGICGITTAQQLSNQGLRVVVLESLRVGVSSTGHSTGNLYETLGKDLIEIRKKYNPEVVGNILSSRREAINLIEANVKRY